MSLLAVPLNVEILQALENESLPLAELRRVAGSPPQTTFRSHLRRFAELGVLERRREGDFPGNVDLGLAHVGREFLGVAAILQSWLAASPNGPVALGSPTARSAIKALVDGWLSGIVRALSARPLTLTELNRLIQGLNYPSLERRLSAMRIAGLVVAAPGKARGTPYAATPWLRHAIGPVAAAALWERRDAAVAPAPIGRQDVESMFLLAVPLVRLSADVTGACRLAVEMRSENGRPILAGAMVALDEGRVVSCVSRLRGEAGAWVYGSVAAWLAAMVEHQLGGLELGGDSRTGTELVGELSRTLIATPERA